MTIIVLGEQLSKVRTMSPVTPLSAALLLVVLNCNLVTSAAVPYTTSSVSQCVYLKNSHFDEYLYKDTSPGRTVDTYANRVFTWRRKTDGHPRDWKDIYQGIWLLENKSTACPGCFSIKAAYYKSAQPLFSVASTDPTFKDDKRRPVYAFIDKGAFPAFRGEDIWEVEKIPGKANHVRISTHNNKNTIEYLYAGDENNVYDNSRRNVYTWSSKTDTNIETWKGVGDWIVEDTECPEF